ncbi:hypothetical protein [Variovorax gossypii]
MTDRHYASMRLQIKALHPELSDAAVTHACNMIGNELRSLHDDIYAVELRGDPFADEPGYYSFFSVTASEKRIFVRVTVD